MIRVHCIAVHWFQSTHNILLSSIDNTVVVDILPRSKAFHFCCHPKPTITMIFRGLLLTTALIGSTSAFVAPAPRAITTKSSELYNNSPGGSTGWDSFRDIRTATDIPDGEESRKFRRTVYSHDGTLKFVLVWFVARSGRGTVYLLATCTFRRSSVCCFCA